MKRVLFYIPTFPTFSQNFITREIEALLEIGDLDIYILSLEKGKGIKLPLSLLGRVTYFTAPKSQRVLDGVKFFFANPLKASAFFWKYASRVFSAGTAVSLLQILERIKPDFIMANWITEGALTANMMSDLSGIQFGVECHAEDIWLTDRKTIEERIRNSKLVLTCTGYNLEYLKKIVDRASAQKINVVHHYINPNLFGGKTAQFNEKPVIYLVGRMVEKKGFIYFIKAAKILKDRGVEFEARIAGHPGTEKLALEKAIKEYGLSDQVKFTCEVSFEEHSHNYLESDIFVVPSIRSSIGDIDGIPNVLIEASLAGLPIVASNLSAIPEVLVDGENGYLVSEKDEKMLADRIETLALDLEKRKTFGKNAKTRILELLSRENTVQKMNDLIKEAANL